MSYSTNLNILDRYIEEHAAQIEEGFSFLIGKRVENFLGAQDEGYFIEGTVLLEDEYYVQSHYSWSYNDESYEETVHTKNKELIEEMNQYYQKDIVGKIIKRIELGGWDRDDFVYIYAYTDETACLEIPYVSVEELYQEGY